MDSIVERIDNEQGWDRLFRTIKLTSAGYDLSCKAAKLPENRNRNRYRDVSPFDHSRVKLNRENDYINASLVEVPKAGRKYILAQGPLSNTSGHFWLMVWEQNSAAVLMLNRVIEKGTPKCNQYWPLDEDPMEFPDVSLVVQVLRQQINQNYTVRYLELRKTDSGEVKEILQFHYTTWPDFGVPNSPASFLDFLNCVRDSGVLEPSVGPPVIHCSAGIGRSGTLALVDSCLVFIERDIEFDVKDTLLEMRRYRMGLIQTAQQLRFSYVAIAEGARALPDTGGNEESTSESDPTPYDSEEDEEDEGKNDNEKENEGNEDQMNNRKRRADESFDHDVSEEKRGKQSEQQPLPINHEEDTNGEEVTNDPVENAVQTEEANNNAAVLRQRNLSEKKAAMQSNINNIKNKMRESEERKNFSWKPYIVGGLVLTVTVGIAVIYRFLH